METQQRFSLRKKQVGLASVVIALAFLGGAVTTVQADSVTAEPVATALGSEAPTREESRTIASPVTYIADDTKSVGSQEVLEQGQDGKLTFETRGDKTTVIREEPAETKVAVGTEPKVETKTTKASTEYHLDENKDFGDDQVVTEAKDGVETTTTTYRVVPDYSKTLDPKVFNDADLSDKKVSFTIDQTKDLPSDQIILADSITVPDNQQDKESIYKLAVNDLIRISSASYLLNLIPGNEKTTQDNIERVIASSYLSDGRYAQAKKDLETIRALYNSKEEDHLKKEYSLSALENIFETITQRYNNSKAITYEVEPEYRFKEPLAEKDRLWFEQQLQKIPLALRKHLLKLVVTDDELPPSEKVQQVNGTAVGLSMANRREIDMNFIDQFTRRTVQKNQKTGQPELVEKVYKTADAISIEDNNNIARQNVLRLLLHELSHNIDFDSGVDLSVLAAGPTDEYKLSSTKEFQEIYEKNYKKSDLLGPYLKNNPEEAFAEGFGYYLRKKIFGVPYAHNLLVDGQVAIVNKGQDFYNQASNPFEETEYYYADLYNKLFEQPQPVKVEVATVKTTNATVQNGLVIYGAKPTEKTSVTPFKVIYKADDSKDYGYVTEVGGSDGQTLVRTTYVLKDNKPSAVETVLSEVAPVDKVVTKGTKTATRTVDLVPVATTYIQDATLAKGQEKADPKQTGSQGYTVVTITYALDPETGVITSNETREVIPMVTRVVYVGTKEDVVTPEQPTQPETPVTPEEPSQPDTPVTPKQPSKTVTANKDVASEHWSEGMAKVVKGSLTEDVRTATAQATQDVINRRQAPSYQASLPETGDDNTAVYSLVGMAMLGLAGVGVRKRRD